MPSSRLSANIAGRKHWPWQRKSPKNSARDFVGITPETSVVAKLFAHPASVPCTELHAPFRRAKDWKHPPFTLLIFPICECGRRNTRPRFARQSNGRSSILFKKLKSLACSYTKKLRKALSMRKSCCKQSILDAGEPV